MTNSLSTPDWDLVMRVHSKVMSEMILSPSSWGLAVQVTENSLLGEVVTDFGEISTMSLTSESDIIHNIIKWLMFPPLLLYGIFWGNQNN